MLSVAYLFSRQGQLGFPAGTDEVQVMEIALEAGAEDIETNDDGSIDLTTSFEDFLGVKEAMIAAGLKPEHAETTMESLVANL